MSEQRRDNTEGRLHPFYTSKTADGPMGKIADIWLSDIVAHFLEDISKENNIYTNVVAAKVLEEAVQKLIPLEYRITYYKNITLHRMGVKDSLKAAKKEEEEV